MRSLLLGLILAAVSISVFAQTVTDVAEVNSLHRGQTTAAEAMAALGAPVHEDHNPDGRFIYLYKFDLPNVKQPQSPHIHGLFALLFSAGGTFQGLRVYEDKEQGNMPEGALRVGSLANEKLIQDTMTGVVEKAATLGCKKIESYKPYVTSMPQGTPGSRVWSELWVVTCSGQTYPIHIHFKESGVGAADYTIQ